MSQEEVTVKKTMGVISDTHGVLRPEVEQKLAGCDLIIHAGDVGGGEVLERLRRIAPLVAVRGNTDHDYWTAQLKTTEYVDCAGARILVVHDIAELGLDPKAAGFSAVIYGHSHEPALREEDGVLYLNPGSVGPRRFHLPVSMAYLTVDEGVLRPELVTLEL